MTFENHEQADVTSKDSRKRGLALAMGGAPKEVLGIATH